jgi:hypothetical protein
MLLSCVILDFLFYFLVKVGFLVYLRLCKLSKQGDLRIAILEKIKLANLGFTSVAFFAH